MPMWCGTLRPSDTEWPEVLMNAIWVLFALRGKITLYVGFTSGLLVLIAALAIFDARFGHRNTGQLVCGEGPRSCPGT